MTTRRNVSRSTLRWNLATPLTNTGQHGQAASSSSSAGGAGNCGWTFRAAQRAKIFSIRKLLADLSCLFFFPRLSTRRDAALGIVTPLRQKLSALDNFSGDFSVSADTIQKWTLWCECEAQPLSSILHTLSTRQHNMLCALPSFLRSYAGYPRKCYTCARSPPRRGEGGARVS